MSFLGNDEELLLVHRDMPNVLRTKRYDLMLTPQFYIFKKEPLNVNYTYQATKLAPSILDELTGDGEYSYSAIKEDDDWILIAYDMTKIEDFLGSKGLPKNYINRVYFSQQSKEYFKVPVGVDNSSALVTVDDTVVMLPKSIVEDEEYAILTNECRPTKGISPVSCQNSLVGQKQAIIISALLLLLTIGYIAEGLRYRNALSSVEEKVDATKNRYPSLKDKSSMVLNNLYDSNYAVDSLQRKIRNRLKDISRLTSKNSKIDRLKIGTKSYEVSITTDAKSIVELRKYAKSKKLMMVDENSSNSFSLKGTL